MEKKFVQFGKAICVLIFVFFFAGFAFSQLECSADAECDDLNPDTIDVCKRPSLSDSGCANLSCTVACSTDADCDDGDEVTLDVCAGAGRCSAVCVNLQNCGDGVEDIGETACNCPEDIGVCEGSVIGTCREFACIGQICQKTNTLGCCGNKICEVKENYSTCQIDCKAKNLQIEIDGVSEEDYYVRGEEITVKATITADEVKITEALVELEGFFGKLKLINDGKHNDGTSYDNIYANTFIVPENIEADVYPLTVNTVFENNRGIKTINLTVEPKLEVRLSLVSEEVFLGDAIEVSGIVSKKTVGKKSDVLITVFSNDLQIAQETIESNDFGEFSYSYRTSFLEEEGEWKIEAFTKDELDNTGFEEKIVIVSSSEITAFLNVELVKELKESYVRGEDASVSISLTDGAGEFVSGAQVSVLVPNAPPLILEEEESGIYEGVIEIGNSFPLGKQEIKINALKTDENSFFAGSTLIEFVVEATQILIEISKPRVRSVQIGEEIEFEVQVEYPDKRPVILSVIDSNVNGNHIALYSVERGVYSGKYVVSELDRPKIFFEVFVDDSFGNIAFADLEIEVSGISFFHYLRKFGLQLVGGIVIIAVMVVVLFYILSKKRRISGLKKSERQIIEEIKKIQLEYFKEGTLDRKNYERLMDKYESNLEDTKKSIEQLEKKE